MKEITAADLLSLRLRTTAQQPGEHKVALESDGFHGAVYHPYYAAFAPALLAEPALAGVDFTVRFKQQKDKSWKVTFLELPEPVTTTMAEGEMAAVLAQNGLALFVGAEPFADGSPQVPFIPR